MSNTITISEALNTLDELEAAQEAWTEGAFASFRIGCTYPFELVSDK